MIEHSWILYLKLKIKGIIITHKCIILGLTFYTTNNLGSMKIPMLPQKILKPPLPQYKSWFFSDEIFQDNSGRSVNDKCELATQQNYFINRNEIFDYDS